MQIGLLDNDLVELRQVGMACRERIEAILDEISHARESEKPALWRSLTRYQRELGHSNDVLIMHREEPVGCAPGETDYRLTRAFSRVAAGLPLNDEEEERLRDWGTWHPENKRVVERMLNG